MRVMGRPLFRNCPGGGGRHKYHPLPLPLPLEWNNESMYDHLCLGKVEGLEVFATKADGNETIVRDHVTS